MESRAFFRITGPHVDIKPKLETLKALWPDVEKYAFVLHKGEREHAHVVVELSKEFKSLKKTLNARITKDFGVPTGNTGRAISDWDGSDEVFAYFFHECGAEAQFYGYPDSPADIERYKKRNEEVKLAIEDNKKKKQKDDRVPMEKVILDEVKASGTPYTPSGLVHRIVDGVKKREWDDPGFHLEKRFHEILLRQEGAKYDDYVISRYMLRLKM